MDDVRLGDRMTFAMLDHLGMVAPDLTMDTVPIAQQAGLQIFDETEIMTGYNDALSSGRQGECRCQRFVGAGADELLRHRLEALGLEPGLASDQPCQESRRIVRRLGETFIVVPDE